MLKITMIIGALAGFAAVICGCATKKEANLPPSPLKKSSLAKIQSQSLVPEMRPRFAIVGALDSFAPVFSLQFNETDRRPVAVLELNADDGFNTYSPIGTITYTNQVK